MKWLDIDISSIIWGFKKNINGNISIAPLFLTHHSLFGIVNSFKSEFLSNQILIK